MPGKDSKHRIFNMLSTNWLICCAMLALIIIVGLWVPHVVLPFVAFALMVVVTRISPAMPSAEGVSCSIMVRTTNYTLGWSALIMLIINALNTHWIPNIFVDPETYNVGIPFIPALIIAPVGAVLFSIAYFRMGKTELCRQCTSRASITMRQGVAHTLVHNEGRVQVRLMAIISIFLSVVGWLYYALFYINVNINSSDRFIFFIVPVALLALSVGFIYTRYAAMEDRTDARAAISVQRTTQVRFLIVKGDTLLLGEVQHPDIPGVTLWDTPAIEDIAATDSMTDTEAHDLFVKKTGIAESFRVRPLFVTRDPASGINVFHYAIFLSDDTPDSPLIKGEWLNLYAIDKLLNTGMLTRPMAYDIHRIYVMTMAFKTYDRDGRRLYPIKNYRPTFRLCDFKDWDIDYSDIHWLYVAEHNEDKPFFRLRKFWRRYISGMDRSWRENRS